MERKRLIFISCIVLSTLFGGGIVNADDQSTKLAGAINDFSIRLYKELVKTNNNLICSGFSVTTVLNMLLAGARTTTETELRNALGYNSQSLSTDQSQTSYHDILTKLRNPNGYDLNVANSMWIQLGFQILSSFNSTIRNTFYSEVKEVDFSKQPALAEKTINDWVNKETKGKIPKLFENSLNSDTRLALVNAIYFKGEWTKKFPTDATKKYQFKVNGSNSLKDIDMMNVKSKFPYGENSDLDAQILELPYNGTEVSMIIVLPKTSHGLASLENQLTPDKLKGFTNGLRSVEVDVKIPKFKSTSTLPLNQILQNLGIKEAFTPQADLSGIDGRKDLYVSTAIQKALIEVNEEGTEAAAATGVGIVTLSLQIPVSFTADHPFLYFIYHKPTNVVLFMGRYSSP